MSQAAADPTVERYLAQVRASLRGMPGPEVDEIVMELRGHIAERLESGLSVEQVLSSLGTPKDLAREYRSDRVAARAECGRSPIVILHSLLLLRRGRIAGSAALFLAAFGYAWAFTLAGAAIEKIFSPNDVGLWHQAGRTLGWRLTVDGPGPAGTREVLGWWLVPLGLLASGAFLLMTQTFALWWIRRSR